VVPVVGGGRLALGRLGQASFPQGIDHAVSDALHQILHLGFQLVQRYRPHLRTRTHDVS
jgi:hypothetical protein